ncbi:IS3 family transposase [Granulosicoccus antarcticus]|uniref:IS3 family transposase n=1 Tax=Granulosicoccus antarcticus TaxID=437505 RepID=UPI003AB0C9AE
MQVNIFVIHTASQPFDEHIYEKTCSESFFHTLKVEAVHGELFSTRKMMRVVAFDYIKTDSNRVIHHA